MHNVSDKKEHLKSMKSLIINTTESLSTEEFIASMYINIPKESKWISDKIEKILLLSKINKKKFEEEFENYIASLVYDINKKSYKDFYKYIYSVFGNILSNKNVIVSTLYLSLFMEIVNQLSPNTKSIWGFKSEDGSPIYKDEPYQILDKISTFLLKKKTPRIRDIELLKYASMDEINTSSTTLVETLINKERIYSNLINMICGVLNEEEQELYPPQNKFAYNKIKPKIRVWKSTEELEHILDDKRYKLPSNGVKCILRNNPDIAGLFLKEKMFDEFLVVIFNITHTDGNESIGMYIKDLNFYFDISLANSITSPSNFKNIILEVYARLTTDLDENYRRLSAIKIVDDIENPSGYYMQQPLMKVLAKNIKTKNENGKIEKHIMYTSFNKEDYIAIIKDITPFIRKLPKGKKASDRAKKLALKYGYELKEGETFVSPFKKKVNTKKS